MAEAYGLTPCPSGFVLKSELLHKPEAQYGFVPKLSHHRGKTIALRAQKLLAPLVFMIHGVIAVPANTGCTSAESKLVCFLLSVFTVFPHKSFDVRQDMVSCWLGDGVSLLTARCQTKTDQGHVVPKLFGGVFMIFVNNNRNFN